MAGALADELQRVAAAEALLALPEPEATAAWRQMPHEALVAEVAKHRSAIRDVAARLRVLGPAPNQPIPTLLPTSEAALLLGAPTNASAAAPAGAAQPFSAEGVQPVGDAAPASGAAAAAGVAAVDDEFAHLGEEGVDYTFGSVDELDPSEWQVPPHCIPIHANVTTFDWPSLYSVAQFDAIMMDPPWQLATANPTRGVALGYSQLADDAISRLPVPQLQREGGLLFVWVINAKYKWTLDLFDRWGYRLVDEVVWVKMTVNRRLAKSHGYYLQHAKEICLVAKKGDPPALRHVSARDGVGSDVIFSERRGQSQKPEEIYDLVEQLVPNGRYLELFARKNNLRNFWVSVGNEVTGTGLPEADMQALREIHCIPGAVYGKGGGGGGGGASAGGAAPDGAAAPTAAPAPVRQAPPPPQDVSMAEAGAEAGAGPGSGPKQLASTSQAQAQQPGPTASTAGPAPGPADAASPAPRLAAAGGGGGSGAGPAAPPGIAAEGAAPTPEYARHREDEGTAAEGRGGRAGAPRESLGLSGLSGLSGISGLSGLPGLSGLSGAALAFGGTGGEEVAMGQGAGGSGGEQGPA
ncbi:hypothetical protein HYH03_004601 [Edaphochlamys debaryana]|uniref:mRNA m(6)A methyltransferase n=1 Tax=Edaphochlamys debaryana TaxID=47281 RepID=A0A835Y7F6_9CHLO|nr:hypothetical protein HYH03_004601 [Edaphochlamys debaryana]|eukprot:KAG2497446.1 hypothetical protein HYH03_004601 [Edaphochlamys debaryana]